jgi:hypothetical protein
VTGMGPVRVWTLEVHVSRMIADQEIVSITERLEAAKAASPVPFGYVVRGAIVEARSEEESPLRMFDLAHGMFTDGTSRPTEVRISRGPRDSVDKWMDALRKADQP